MMTWRFKNTLSDERGVTILMALFALLVAAMVCVVILTAAVSTVKQAKADQVYEQQALTLQSAGDLIASSIGNNAKTTCHVTETETSPPGGRSYSANISGTGCIVDDELEDAVKNALETGLPSQGGFTVKVTAEDSTQQLAPVRVSYVLREKSAVDEHGAPRGFQLVFTLDLLNGDNGVVQTLYLQMDSTKVNENTRTVENKAVPEGETEEVVVSVTTTVTYDLFWTDYRFYVADKAVSQ